MYFRVKNTLKNNRNQTLKYQYVMIKKAWSLFLLIKKKKKKSASKAPITGVN
jgi:hypothetical protein